MISNKVGVFNYLWDLIYVRHVLPYLKGDHSLRVAWGCAMGIFIGLTPTAGFQIKLLFILWLLLYPFRLNFNLPIAISMTFISNPITFVPLYFTYYWIGSTLHPGHTALAYASFNEKLIHVFEHSPDTRIIDYIIQVIERSLVSIGWPMLLGSLVIAIPLSILAFFWCYSLAVRLRKNGSTK